MKPRLRNCPCCDGAAERARSKHYYIVQCTQCRLRVVGSSWNDVEGRWNLRATDAILATQRAKLRELNVKLDRLEGRL